LIKGIDPGIISDTSEPTEAIERRMAQESEKE